MTATNPGEIDKQIEYLARALKAPRIREAAGRFGDQARDAGWSHEEYLAAVLDREVPAATDIFGRRCSRLLDLATDEPSQLHCPAPLANDPLDEVLRKSLWRAICGSARNVVGVEALIEGFIDIRLDAEQVPTASVFNLENTGVTQRDVRPEVVNDSREAFQIVIPELAHVAVLSPHHDDIVLDGQELGGYVGFGVLP